MTVFGYRLPGMSSLIVWAILWEIVGRLDLTFFIPPISEVVATLIEVIGTDGALTIDCIPVRSELFLARYDSTFTPWFLRRNEVLVELDLQQP